MASKLAVGIPRTLTMIFPAFLRIITLITASENRFYTKILHYPTRIVLSTYDLKIKKRKTGETDGITSYPSLNGVNTGLAPTPSFRRMALKFFSLTNSINLPGPQRAE